MSFERGTLSASLRKQLADDVADFRAGSRERTAGKLEESGRNIIDVEENRRQLGMVDQGAGFIGASVDRAWLISVISERNISAHYPEQKPTGGSIGEDSGDRPRLGIGEPEFS